MTKNYFQKGLQKESVEKSKTYTDNWCHFNKFLGKDMTTGLGGFMVELILVLWDPRVYCI